MTPRPARIHILRRASPPTTSANRRLRDLVPCGRTGGELDGSRAGPLLVEGPTRSRVLTTTSRFIEATYGAALRRATLTAPIIEPRRALEVGGVLGVVAVPVLDGAVRRLEEPEQASVAAVA